MRLLRLLLCFTLAGSLAPAVPLQATALETPGSMPAAPTLAERPGLELDAESSLVLPVPPRTAHTVLEAIQQRHGEPLPGFIGGKPFHNRERRLPPGQYREYDIHPRRSGQDRGPERLVIEQRTGQAYYTPDHYGHFIPMN